ncbi:MULTISPECIES: acetolactate synthase large subunit [Ramlibacter]|uniref:Acetolactate synthase large subunit n=1 Tax=Ramlibacter pinisoli TaxID=2682844 RepID=A0A6N8IQF8_9BURK|nr:MULTISPECIES: acetolactate synthase large subunit [Ramlibacter]MBA2964078.1 acetolactate synthase large subunit [Ramlibacter sp. CGMCC 1.13660]MVQ29044.1 acetolactate synthase large subunit [Ramlibacter pinisoli]
MNGAQALLRTLVAAGVDTCFANPGTSEMHFVAGLDEVPGLRAIPALAEGVATGAADGYARIAGKPAATLLHCGPGLANGLANLHNARRAGVPVLNLIGDQAHHHRPLDPPLAADTEALAKTVSAWTRTSLDACAVAPDAASAVAAARAGGGRIASLVLPSDVCWDEGAQVAAPQPVPPRAGVPDDRLAHAAACALEGEGTLLLLGQDALHGPGLALAARIAERTGARLLAGATVARMARGDGTPRIGRMPYAPEPATRLLAGVRRLLLVGARRPVFAFAGPDGHQRPEPPGLHVALVAAPEEDVVCALGRLAERLGCAATVDAPRRERPSPAAGDVSPQAFARSLGALLPPGAIVVDEGVSFGRAVFDGTLDAAAHDWLQLTGGAIGMGLPVATGAAVAGAGRRVVVLQADGSALYNVQALWTQARERLDVTTVIFSNRRYAILHDEMRRVRATAGPAASALFSLGQPDIRWDQLANGFGVASGVAATMDQFNALFERSMATAGPFLIELAVP